MPGPFLLAETPRGGSFGHRFIIPPGLDLQSTDVEVYFQRAALGPGPNFIAVSQQVLQALPNGAVRQGAETLLLAGLGINNPADDRVEYLGRALEKMLPDLDRLVAGGINWEEVGSQTMVVRQELGDWLGKVVGDPQTWSGSTGNVGGPPAGRRHPKLEIFALLAGVLLALLVGGIILFCWFL